MAEKISLNALRTFDACARSLNYRQAAEELHVTPAAVSYQMRALQADLGIALFRRCGRNVELTAEGLALFEEVRPGIERLERGIARLRRRPQRQPLRLQAYMSISSRWLLPRLTAFRKAHPREPIELYTSWVDWDFRPDKADLGLIFGAEGNPSLFYFPLGGDSLIAVAAPGLFADQAAPQSAAALLDYPLIAIEDGRRSLERWFDAAGITLTAADLAQRIDTHFVALEAVAAGEGIAVVQSLFAAQDLHQGRLLQVLSHRVEEQGTWSLACRKERREEPRIALFASFLAEAFAQ